MSGYLNNGQWHEGWYNTELMGGEFVRTQSAYQPAFDQLFNALDWVEIRLARQHYLVGDTPTEADWRLFTTLIRFDADYYGFFGLTKF